MKITYIFPPLGHKGRRVTSMPLAPPVLEYLAGMTTRLKPDSELRLVNANVEDFTASAVAADIVGITILTHQASWAYRTADELRSRGITVVLGGPHPSALPEEAKAHADAVLIGEAESVLERLFDDFERGLLQPFYRGDLLPLDDLPHPRRDLLKGYHFHSFATSRGCPYQCKFCATPGMHGHSVRYRPIGEVVADIASFRHRMWFSTDADIWGPDVSRYIELFREMAASLPGMYWVGEGSIASVQHPRGEELLSRARRSGLMQVWVGWESFNSDILKQYGAGPKMLSRREDALRMIRDNGIDPVLFLMLGARGESLDEYDRVVELCDRLAVTAHPVMVAPYPGTELYQEWKADLLYGRDWDFYDGMHAITNEDGEAPRRDAALVRIWRELFTLKRIVRRLAALPMKGFPTAHIASLIVQSALRRAFRQYADAGVPRELGSNNETLP